MKFESPIGIGEVCEYNYTPIMSVRSTQSLLVKVVSVVFDADGGVSYVVEHTSSRVGMQRFHAFDNQLTGDPDFDQDSGGYPVED